MDSQTARIGAGGAAVVGVAFGMARYAYGLTLPQLEEAFELSEVLLGVVSSGTFVGYLLALLAAPWAAGRWGPRIPTTIGGLAGALGTAMVALAPSAPVLVAGAVIAGSAAGWVWAPYSDIVTRALPEERQSLALAAITTGTGVGLMGLAGLGLLAATFSWRWVWAGIAVASLLAAVANVFLVPRLGRPEEEGSIRALWRREMLPPLYFSALYFAAITVFFTYAGEAATEEGQGASAAGLVFFLIGLGGLAGLVTGRIVRAVGPASTGLGSVLVVSAMLVLLGLAGSSLLLTGASALVFGAAFMVGSSLLAIWTAQVAPDMPGNAFTAALVVGAVTSILTPLVLGPLVESMGLATILLGAAAVCAVLCTGIPLAARRAVA